MDASAVFFPGPGLPGDRRPETADLLIQLHQVARQFLELAERADLAFCFALCFWGRERLGHGLAVDLVSQTEIGAVAGIAAPMTMAAGVPQSLASA